VNRRAGVDPNAAALTALSAPRGYARRLNALVAETVKLETDAPGGKGAGDRCRRLWLDDRQSPSRVLASASARLARTRAALPASWRDDPRPRMRETCEIFIESMLQMNRPSRRFVSIGEDDR
jgi:hypothetical protein